MRSLRCALLQRGVRVCGPQCVRPWERRKERLALRCVAGICGLVLGQRTALEPRRLDLHARGCSIELPTARTHSLTRTHSAHARVRTTSSTHAHAHARARTHSHTHTDTHSLTHAHTDTRTYVCAVRAASYMTNFFSMFAVCTMFTASIAHLLFSKPRGRIRRTRHTDRLRFEALCLVCAPPASTRDTHCEHSGNRWEYSRRPV